MADATYVLLTQRESLLMTSLAPIDVIFCDELISLDLLLCLSQD